MAKQNPDCALTFTLNVRLTVRGPQSVYDGTGDYDADRENASGYVQALLAQLIKRDAGRSGVLDVSDVWIENFDNIDGL